MKKNRSLWSTHRLPYTAFIILSVLILGMTALVGYADSAPFQRFIGKMDPVLTMTGAVAIGGLCCTLLLKRGWGKIYQPNQGKEVWGLIGLTVFLAFNSIWIDGVLVFPENINIPWPDAVLFYPAIGFFVEVLFHLVPISLLLLLGSLFIKEKVFQKSIWPIIILVALLEPSFQILFMEEMPLWAQIAVWVNVFLFNVLQLYTFKRIDFIRMYALRLVFYLIWHIVWGIIRLELLF